MTQKTLLQLLRGGAAHVDSLACLDALGPETVGRRAPGFPHSIWQLVGHMNYWMDHELQRIAGQAPVYPEHAALSWPAEAAPAGPEDWSRAVGRFRELLERLAELARAGDEVLDRPVPPTDTTHATYGETVGAVLWETVVHNSYHVGQVALLRRAFGAWPPPAGGDTW